MKRILLTLSILYSFYGWSQNAAIAVPHAFQGTHFKTFKEQGETIRTWYEISGRYSEDYMEVIRRIYQPNRDQTLRILDTYGDEGYTAVKIESLIHTPFDTPRGVLDMLSSLHTITR